MPTQQNNKPLTTRTIQNLKPDDSLTRDIGEYRGLHLRSGKSGKKTFFYRYRSPLNNKLTQVKIGNFPSISLVKARAALLELKCKRNDGICPATELKDLKQRKKDNASRETDKNDQFTISSLIELYLQNYIEDRRAPNGKIIEGARKKKGQIETRRTLYVDVVEKIGDKLATEISRRDVVDLIGGIIDRGAKVQAGSVLRELSSAYEYAIGNGIFSDSFANPALLAKASLRQTKVKLTSNKGRRVFSDDELSQFLVWLPNSAFRPKHKSILKLTLWTGCRTGEICAIKIKDINFNNSTLRIKESKTDVERYIQLPRQAIAYLSTIKPERGEYLLRSGSSNFHISQKSISEHAWVLRKKGKMLDIDSWTPHDLRRTVRTGLSRLQCPSEVAEAVLGHSRKGIEGTYDLHSYDRECRTWLQIWADHLDNL